MKCSAVIFTWKILISWLPQRRFTTLPIRKTYYSDFRGPATKIRDVDWVRGYLTTLITFCAVKIAGQATLNPAPQLLRSIPG